MNIVHQAVATVSVQVNVFRGGSADGSAFVGFFSPEGSLGGASASASFYRAWQTVEIPGQPLDDLDTIPEGDWWMMK